MILTTRGPRARAGHGRLWLVGLSALLALFLAACGPTTSHTGGATSAPAHVQTIPGKAIIIRPCSAVYTGGYNSTVTLTNSSSDVTGSAHTGDTIEIRMKGQYYWRLASVTPETALTLTHQGGLLDSASGTCAWIFHANTPANAVVSFTGSPICDPSKACPQFIIKYTFKLHIA